MISRAPIRAYQLIRDFLGNLFSRAQVHYVVEARDWSIRKDGEAITGRIPQKARITTHPHGIRRGTLHYGSINTYPEREILCRPARRVVTWFHIVDGDPRVKDVPAIDKAIDLWHTSCTLTAKKLIAAGAASERIKVIPLGVDTAAFHPPTQTERQRLREQLGIPKSAFVIGSFQKDGVGWGEGEEPKLEKGPDVFCDCVEGVAKHHEVFVLLTGPARGYVKRRLEKAGIPYAHRFLGFDEIPRMYHALDAYVISSREEGGPKAILESWATGVPLVTTRVGMAPDICEHGKDSLMVSIMDGGAIASAVERLIGNRNLRRRLVENGQTKVAAYDWSAISSLYHKDIYSAEVLTG